MKVKIKKILPSITVPSYAHPGDAGLDLHSLEEYELQRGESKIFPLGFALELPDGYMAIVKDKSSLPKNAQIHTMGGVFDSGFRGEYNVNLINLGKKAYRIKKNDKIAQLVIVPVARVELKESDTLNETSRGLGQFGSTGR